MKSILLGLLVFLIVGCEDYYTGSALSQVEYRVVGSGPSVDVTLSNATGGTEQYSDQTLPYSYTFTTTEEDQFVYISAQINGTGTITSEIYRKSVNGGSWVLYDSSTSSGAYVIATVSGSI